MMKLSKWGRVMLLIFVLALAVLFFMKRAHLGTPGSCSMTPESESQALKLGSNLNVS